MLSPQTVKKSAVTASEFSLVEDVLNQNLKFTTLVGCRGTAIMILIDAFAFFTYPLVHLYVSKHGKYPERRCGSLQCLASHFSFCLSISSVGGSTGQSKRSKGGRVTIAMEITSLSPRTDNTKTLLG